jgi:hypothetical protein
MTDDQSPDERQSQELDAPFPETEEDSESPPDIPGPQLVKQFVGMMRSRSLGGSFLDRLSTSQLTKLIDQDAADSQRRHELAKQHSWMVFWLLLSVPAFILILCLLFLYFDKGDLLNQLFTLIMGAVGGGGAVSWAASSKRSPDP